MLWSILCCFFLALELMCQASTLPCCLLSNFSDFWCRALFLPLLWVSHFYSRLLHICLFSIPTKNACVVVVDTTSLDNKKGTRTFKFIWCFIRNSDALDNLSVEVMLLLSFACSEKLVNQRISVFICMLSQGVSQSHPTFILMPFFFLLTVRWVDFLQFIDYFLLFSTFLYNF